jgi:very-short-patch-repair endonuclease
MTTRSWTVMTLLGSLPEPAAVHLADRALQRRWLDSREIVTRLRLYPKRHGNSRLRRLLDLTSDGAAATSERKLHQLLRRGGITGWKPNYAVWANGELVAVLDVALPGRLIAIEVDGMAFHTDVDQFRRDRRRQNALVALGWTVLRFTWADLTERPEYVISTVRRLAA